MNNHKIHLIVPPERSTSPVLPFAFIYLAAILEKNGISTRIIDIKRPFFQIMDYDEKEKVVDEALSLVKKESPLMVGLTCFTAEFNSVISLAKKIKKSVDTKIVVGGTHANLIPHDFFFDDSPIDFLVIGEGEETLPELVNAYEKSQPLDEIEGLAYLKDNKYFTTGPRSSLVNLDKMPLPAYDKIDMEAYLQPHRQILRSLFMSGVHILTTRGCPYPCTFCANAASKVRFRSVKSVIDELLFLINEYNIDSFYFSDDTFAIKKDRVYEFCEQIQANKIDLIWGVQSRVNQIDEGMIKEMRQAGCRQLDFGVETGSQKAIDRMKKGVKVEDSIKAFELCKKYKMRTFANIMFNTPGETEEDVKLTLDLMKKLKASHYGISLTMPLIGSEIYEKYINPKLTPDEYEIFNDPHLYNKILQPRFRLAAHNLDLDKLYLKVNMKYYLRNSLFESTLDKKYWKTILHSPRKFAILNAIFKNLVRQVAAYFKYLRRFIFVTQK